MRATIGPAIDADLPQALLDPPSTTAAVDIGPDQAVIRNGAVAAEMTAAGALRFLNAVTGAELLAEAPLERIPLYLRDGAELDIRA